MKKVTAVLVALTMCMSVMAQESNKQKEVGLIFSNLDSNFGFSFKTGTNKKLWRFNVINATISKHDNKEIKTETKDFGFNIALGREYRKEIVENFEFRYGFDVTYDYFSRKTTYNEAPEEVQMLQESKLISQAFGVNLVLGVNYSIKNKFVIGAEVLPNLRYSKGKTKSELYYKRTEENDTYSNVNYGVSSESCRLTLAYRF